MASLVEPNHRSADNDRRQMEIADAGAIDLNEIPMNATQDPSASKISESGHLGSAPSHTILYVDDDASIRRICARVLVDVGYRVDVAADGQAGWEALRLLRYDLLITDDDMPRLSGLDLVKRLRSERQTLPVILVSGSVDVDEDYLRGRQVATILKKPFTHEQLLGAVEEVLHVTSGVRKRGDLFLPVLAEALAHIQPAPRWGINE